MSNLQSSHNPRPLQGNELIIAALLLALANFVVVLDMTIANVSISHIAGGLAISITEGTYVITSYAVAEAIMVPLTGWLAGRFGAVRVFTTCIMLFGVFSCVCGLSQNLETLIFGRIMQGLSGGPLMPLSQTLLMQIFPQEKRHTAIGLWSMTTLIAPIMGPIVGGYICDNYEWGFIFFINIPIAIVCSLANLKLLYRFETTILKQKIDFVGLMLLILWVAALQIMLDEGKNFDWFESNIICMLLITSVIGFICFLIWEFTNENPIVDMRVFRHRGYSASVVTMSLAFGSYFGSVVLTPLWLQNYMGYTATWSGCVTAATGILAIIAAPFAAKFSNKFDPRILIFFGVTWIGLVTCFRSFSTTDLTYVQIVLPLLIQGIGMPFFFVPLTYLALADVNPAQTASAAGLMSFIRTLSGAISTSIVTTNWETQTNVLRTDMVNRIFTPEQFKDMLGASGVDQEGATYLLDQILQSQAIMLSTNHIFLSVTFTFVFAAIAVWVAPKPTQTADVVSH